MKQILLFILSLSSAAGMLSASNDFSYTATAPPGSMPDGIDQNGNPINVWTVSLTPGIDGNQGGANGSGVYFGETFDSFTNGWEAYSYQSTGTGQGGSVNSVNTFAGGALGMGQTVSINFDMRDTDAASGGLPAGKVGVSLLNGSTPAITFYIYGGGPGIYFYTDAGSTAANAGAMQYQYQSPFNIAFTVTGSNTYSAVAGTVAANGASDVWSGRFSGFLTGIDVFDDAGGNDSDVGFNNLTISGVQTQPQLSAALTLNGSQISLSWPGWATNYALYATTNLATNNWQPVANVPASSNNLLLPVTNCAQEFFSLGPSIYAMSLLHSSGTNIVNGSGAIVQLKGLNLGGWLVMEPWMCPMDSGGLPDTYSAITNLDKLFGVATEQSLIHTYQTNWITTDDLDNITNAGFNCVRVPVWWGNFYSITNTTSSGWRPDAFAVLDWVVTNCATRGIYVMIDMHGVIGGQSTSDDTGQQNQNLYWSSSTDQSETAYMWTQIATHYKGNNTVAAYDVMNEPDGASGTSQVWPAYASLYTTIRAADPNHILIMEGTFGNWDWGMLPNPSVYGWTNIVYSMHEYQYNSTLAGVEAGSDNQVTDFHNHLSWNVPDYIGEWNDMGFGAACYDYSINDYNNAGMSWTMWAYKAAAGLLPNGWGWYDPTYWPTTPNLETNTAATIAGDWQQWRTTNSFSVNSAVGL
jgi:aryl-phospho-beta-D-glucosidase BglC (GH1 family)